MGLGQEERLEITASTVGWGQSPQSTADPRIYVQHRWTAAVGIAINTYAGLYVYMYVRERACMHMCVVCADLHVCMGMCVYVWTCPVCLFHQSGFTDDSESVTSENSGILPQGLYKTSQPVSVQWVLENSL